jgi:hypothetical protein
MNCCDDYGNCTQGKDCPVRTYRVCNQDCNQGRNCQCSNQPLSRSSETLFYIYLFSLLVIALVVWVLITLYPEIAQ